MGCAHTTVTVYATELQMDKPDPPSKSIWYLIAAVVAWEMLAFPPVHLAGHALRDQLDLPADQLRDQLAAALVGHMHDMIDGVLSLMRGGDR